MPGIGTHYFFRFADIIKIMLVIGIPMYVCATGSIPIAAALMMKGLNPGAAFVFLLAGPVTNAVSMTVLSRDLGKRALFLYLLSISVSSILLGSLLDRMWGIFNMREFGEIMLHKGGMLPVWIGTGASIVLVALILFNAVKRKKT